MGWTVADFIAGLLQILEEDKGMAAEDIEGEYEKLAKSFSLLVPDSQMRGASCKI